MSFIRTLSNITCVPLFITVFMFATNKPELPDSFREGSAKHGSIQVAGSHKVNAITRFNTSHQPFTNYLTNDMLPAIEDVRKNMC